MRPITLLLTLLSASFMYGCYSHDLGDEKPNQVPVKLGLADWDNAGAVIGAKCASCHTVDRRSFVPANTPRHLDQMGARDFYTNRKNRNLIRDMLESVVGEDDAGDRGRELGIISGRDGDDHGDGHEDGPNDSQDDHVVMPPKFATPLYADEKEALVGFLRASLKALESSTPNPPPVGPELPPPPVPLKFSDVESIVIANCAKSGCHDGASGLVSLRTREDFVKMRSRPLNALKRGSMPADNPDFRDTEDGKKLIQYLMSPMTE